MPPIPPSNTPTEEVQPVTLLSRVTTSKITLIIIAFAVTGTAFGSYIYYTSNTQNENITMEQENDTVSQDEKNNVAENNTDTMPSKNNTPSTGNDSTAVKETAAAPKSTPSGNSNTHYINEIDDEGLSNDEQDIVFEKTALFRKRHVLEIIATGDDLREEATSRIQEIIAEMQEKKFGEDEYKEFLRRYTAIIKQNNVTPLSDKELLALLESHRAFGVDLLSMRQHPEAFDGVSKTAAKLEQQRIFDSQYDVYSSVYLTVHGR